MSDQEREKWNRSYAQGCENPRVCGPAAGVLDWLSGLLSPGSQVLDLGAGRLRNAVPLARAGHEVLAIDIAEEGFKNAIEAQPRIQTLVADLDDYRLPECAFDLILAVHYLNRDLAPHLISALRPGGFLALEIRLSLPEAGRERPAFRLLPSEAIELYSELELLRFEEIADKEAGLGRYLFRKA